MRLDKIYTKVGDKGNTLLANGAKISKGALRIEAYGNIDELNSHVGLLRDHLQNIQNPSFEQPNQNLLMIQHELFDIGGELATPTSENDKAQPKFQDHSFLRLEAEMDEYNESLKPLKNFVLPGGHSINSQTHICRCICRRSERSIIRLHETEFVSKSIRIYINRLSDWFFILSRVFSQLLKVDEVLWQQNIK